MRNDFLWLDPVTSIPLVAGVNKAKLERSKNRSKPESKQGEGTESKLNSQVQNKYRK